MRIPRSDPSDRLRRELLQLSDELLEDVELLRLGDRGKVPARLATAIEKLQLDAGRGEASIAPATLRSAHEVVLSVQYRLMSGNPRNRTTGTHLGRGVGQATVRALAGGGTWKHLVLPALGPLSAAEWRTLVDDTLERALDRWAYTQHHATQAARDQSGAKQALARTRVAWSNYWELHEEAERLLAGAAAWQASGGPALD